MRCIQTGCLFDLCHTGMRKTRVPHCTMDKAPIPSVLLQSIFQMFTNASVCNAFFRKQDYFIFRQISDYFIYKGIQLYSLYHITRNAFFL